jgi:hypothetical protein
MHIRLAVLSGLLLVSFAAPPQLVFAQAMNACGCYRDDQGTCKCTKKSKCGCPEECEPVGCEEKRQKQADREADAALKQMEARERKKGAEAAKTKAAATQKGGVAKRRASKQVAD